MEELEQHVGIINVESYDIEDELFEKKISDTKIVDETRANNSVPNESSFIKLEGKN
jgi:hypothetical protein